jgi:hypothetical protein
MQFRWKREADNYGLLLPYDRHPLRRSDVVPGRPFDVVFNVEVFGDDLFRS